MGIGYSLIDANERNPEPLAAVRQNFPVPQVKTANDEGLCAARRLVETFRRLEYDAIAPRQRLDVEALGEGSPEFSHIAAAIAVRSAGDFSG